MAVTGTLSGVLFLAAVALMSQLWRHGSASGLGRLAGLALICAIACWWVGVGHWNAADDLARDAVMDCSRCSSETEKANAWLIPAWTALAVAALSGGASLVTRLHRSATWRAAPGST